MARLRSVAAALLLPVCLPAQGKKPGPELELNLEARDVVRGAPTTFHVIVRNRSDHDIRLPEPSLGCASAVNGTVLLMEKFKPKAPGSDPDAGLGSGCVGSWWPYSHDVLERAKSWLLLRPGGYLERVASPSRLHYVNHGAGTYDLSAEYVPPALSVDERRSLTNAGFTLPKTKLVSKHVILKKDQ